MNPLLRYLDERYCKNCLREMRQGYITGLGEPSRVGWYCDACQKFYPMKTQNVDGSVAARQTTRGEK